MTESSVRSMTHMTVVQRSFIGAMLVTFLLSGGVTFGADAPDVAQPVQAPMTGMKLGQITAKHDTSVEISGRGYAFHSKVTFADDEGQLREWKEFKKGDYVQYHLKQERIDFLVLELPK